VKNALRIPSAVLEMCVVAMGDVALVSAMMNVEMPSVVQRAVVRRFQGRAPAMMIVSGRVAV
jgi:hypothetical protein